MSKHNLIQDLAKMAGRKDDSGLTVFDKQKFQYEMDKNRNFMRKNKDTFEEGERKFTTCSMYDPCPICEKCMVKASHLYIKCQTCKIPLCSHDANTKKRMIVRRNFTRTVRDKKIEKAFNKVKKDYEESR